VSNDLLSQGAADVFENVVVGPVLSAAGPRAVVSDKHPLAVLRVGLVPKNGHHLVELSFVSHRFPIQFPIENRRETRPLAAAMPNTRINRIMIHATTFSG